MLQLQEHWVHLQREYQEASADKLYRYTDRYNNTADSVIYLYGEFPELPRSWCCCSDAFSGKSCQ